MKTKRKERRVVNLDKVSFDIIKKYRDDNDYKLPNWIGHTCVRHIRNMMELEVETPTLKNP